MARITSWTIFNLFLKKIRKHPNSLNQHFKKNEDCQLGRMYRYTYIIIYLQMLNPVGIVTLKNYFISRIAMISRVWEMNAKNWRLAPGFCCLNFSLYRNLLMRMIDPGVSQTDLLPLNSSIHVLKNTCHIILKPPRSRILW